MENDWRNLQNGLIICQSLYADQPYILKTDDGAWLCCVTVCKGHEGAADQHVETRRSTDSGLTWSEPVRLEPANTPENSYSVMLKVPSGRVYIFYNHNTDNVREVLSHDRQRTHLRVDSLGHFVFKYSDDHGRSWSAQRYDIPIRNFQCDLDNVYAGKLRFFWNVGKPFVRAETAYVSLHKIGELGRGFFQRSEGALLASKNLLSESDPTKINWETLPDGLVGLRTPPGGGSVAEEQSCVVLSDGSICATYRSCDGYPVECYSRDGGHSWEEPRYKRFADGRLFKNPRAACFTWKCTNGKYLCWFHNQGGRFIRELWESQTLDKPIPCSPYFGRNPVWLCGGIEQDGEIIWGEPQILLYDENPLVGISYPDFLEDAGRYYFSETQKSIARLHPVPTSFLEGLWGQANKTLLTAAKGGSAADLSPLPVFYQRDAHCHYFRGRSTSKRIALHFNTANCQSGRWCAAWDTDGMGFEVTLTTERRVQLRWREAQQQAIVESEILPEEFKLLELEIDSGPAIISFRCDGRFCDGKEQRQFGWQRYPDTMHCLHWSKRMLVDNRLKRVEIYELD